jgi:hypothetical protein
LARILVLDGHSAAALAVTRSAGQCGHWVAVGGNRGLFAATKLSRYCKLGFDYPISTDDPGAFVDALVEFVRAHSIDLIIPITDWTLGPISVQRERFAGLCHIAMPSPRALDTVSDKYRTIKLAESFGIGIPRTHLVESLGDLSQWEENQFPVVVKDRFSVRWSNDPSTKKKQSGRAVAGGQRRIDSGVCLRNWHRIFLFCRRRKNVLAFPVGKNQGSRSARIGEQRQKIHPSGSISRCAQRAANNGDRFRGRRNGGVQEGS